MNKDRFSADTLRDDTGAEDLTGAEPETVAQQLQAALDAPVPNKDRVYALWKVAVDGRVMGSPSDFERWMEIIMTAENALKNLGDVRFQEY